MTAKKMTQVGNPIIRKRSGVVKNIKSKRVKKLIKDLSDTMRRAGLVGIAAPQLGINERIFLTEIRNTDARKVDEKMEKSPLKIFINPQLKYLSKKIISKYEGCGSVSTGALFAKVPRAYKVVISAFNENGIRFELAAKGLLARVIQHEMDHLNGKVFLDRVVDTKSLMERKEYLKKYR
jgi:peptide deformylase